MATNERLPYDVRKQIYDLGQQYPEKSNRQLAKELRLHDTTILKYRKVAPVPDTPEQPIEVTTDLEASIKKLLNKQAMSRDELADALDLRPSERERVNKALDTMRARAINISLRSDNKLEMHPFIEPGGKSDAVIPDRGDGWQVFGATADNHLCNKHERLDVLNSLYDRFAAEGITKVYNAGNWIDGEAPRINKYELHTHGMDNQLDYMIEHYPQREGITTHYVSGLDHEGWYIKQNCVNIGEYLQMRAEKAGRHDLKHLGVMEADVALKHGSGESVLRVQHAGGGSAYALSYTSQKSVESFQGGEKPHVLLVGHYHKFDYCYPREVHTVQVGCTEDQSGFMRQKKIAAHLGGVICWLKQDERGAIAQFRVEWIPFYDRKYYQRSFE